MVEMHESTKEILKFDSRNSNVIATLVDRHALTPKTPPSRASREGSRKGSRWAQLSATSKAANAFRMQSTKVAPPSRGKTAAAAARGNSFPGKKSRLTLPSAQSNDLSNDRSSDDDLTKLNAELNLETDAEQYMGRIDASKQDLHALIGVLLSTGDIEGQTDASLARDFANRRKLSPGDDIENGGAFLRSVTRHALVAGGSGKPHPFDGATLGDFDPIYRRKDHPFTKTPAVPGMIADPGARRNPAEHSKHLPGERGQKLTKKQIEFYKDAAAKRLKEFELAYDSDRDKFETEADVEAIRQKQSRANLKKKLQKEAEARADQGAAKRLQKADETLSDEEAHDDDTARLRRRQKRQRLLEVTQRAEQGVQRHNAKNVVNRRRHDWNQAKYHAQTITRNEPFFIKDLRAKINGRYNSLRMSFAEKYERENMVPDVRNKTTTELGKPVFNLSHKRRVGRMH